MKEFIDFCEKIFCSISPYEAESVKKEIKKYEKLNGYVPCTTIVSDELLLQGDIFSELPYYKVDINSGGFKLLKTKVQLLSNTCDATRDNYILFAPVLPIDSIDERQLISVKNNTVYNYMYIYDKIISEYVIDYSLVFSYPRKIFEDYISQKKITKITSLSAIGYRLFLVKLTAFLMRPEDIEANSSRNIF